LSGKYILLVEDNSDDAELTLRALRRAQQDENVILVRDGVEALDFLLGRGEPVSPVKPQHLALILLDLKLPRVNGLEVLRQIREQDVLRYIPVVVLTSSDEQSDIEKSYALGANSFLRKPVDFEEFNETICCMVQYWMKYNQIFLE